MKSPFPGMDPYIEACGLWSDFHNHFVEAIAARVADTTPDRYLVRTGERSYVVLIDDEDKRERPFEPDVTVTTRRKKPSRKKIGPAIAEMEPDEGMGPVTMRAFIDESHRETFVEIYESSPEQRLVTCVEVLSPSNKRPGTQGWKLYHRKRQALMLEGVNLVEIDLLRGGQRMPMIDRWPDSPYTYLVARGYKAPLCRVWRAHYRLPLPVLAVPLTRPDADVSVELQSLVDAIYRRFRYGQSLDYRKPLKPPLADEEAVWVEQQIRSRQPNAPGDQR